MLTVPAGPDAARLFAPFAFEPGRPVVVAVSGGSDSLALLHLFKSFCAQRRDGPVPFAVTVDHGLRPGSAEEARAVGEICAGYGIGHRILRWSGDKPATGLQAAARAARHALLAEAAREAGAAIVLTAHTLDDQAETLSMRRARGPGRGEAGIARASLHDGGVWFLRPLLETRRETLRDYLRGAGRSWFDDPGNEDRRFERVRVRQRLRSRPQGEREIADSTRHVRKAVAERERLNTRAALLIAEFAERPAAGLVQLDPALPSHGDGTATVLALRALLAAVGGREHLPDAGRVAQLVERLRAGSLRATLSRCVIDARASGIFVYRETRGLPCLSAAETVLWDGRYRITIDGRGGKEWVVAAAGCAADTGAASLRDVPRGAARGALAAEPAILGGDGITRPLTAGARKPPGVHVAPVVAPWTSVLPVFDVELARAVARLIGAAEPPAPPLAGHKQG